MKTIDRSTRCFSLRGSTNETNLNRMLCRKDDHFAQLYRNLQVPSSSGWSFKNDEACTFVSSHRWISTSRNAFAMANFASRRAKRMPTQFLRQTFGLRSEPQRCLTEVHRRKEEKPSDVGLIFQLEKICRRKNVLNQSSSKQASSPFWKELFRLQPNLRIMMNRINRNGDDRSFRYLIIAQLIISRCDTIESERFPVDWTWEIAEILTEWTVGTCAVFHGWPCRDKSTDWVSRRSPPPERELRIHCGRKNWIVYLV